MWQFCPTWAGWECLWLVVLVENVHAGVSNAACLASTCVRVFFAIPSSFRVYPDVSAVVIKITVTAHALSVSLYLKHNKMRIIIYNYPRMHVSGNQCRLENYRDKRHFSWFYIQQSIIVTETVKCSGSAEVPGVRLYCIVLMKWRTEQGVVLFIVFWDLGSSCGVSLKEERKNIKVRMLSISVVIVRCKNMMHFSETLAYLQAVKDILFFFFFWHSVKKRLTFPRHTFKTQVCGEQAMLWYPKA